MDDQDAEWLVIIGGYAGLCPRAVFFFDFDNAKKWAHDRRIQYGCSADVIFMPGMEEAELEYSKAK